MYRDSSLETVVGSIAEQRQIFKGADHAFLWKPKLRIPDIYESRGEPAPVRTLSRDVRLLHRRGARAGRDPRARCGRQSALLPASHDRAAFNTAIVKGYNALTGAGVKLGRWDQYLAMRRGVPGLNEIPRAAFQRPGGHSRVLFDLGSGRHTAPPREADGEALARWEADLNAVREDAARADQAQKAAREDDRTHTEVQSWLRDLELVALGFSVWVASNDRNRPYAGGRLGDGCIEALPEPLAQAAGAETISSHRRALARCGPRGGGIRGRADDLDLSGIVRMLDPALGVPDGTPHAMFLVAPHAREADMKPAPASGVQPARGRQCASFRYRLEANGRSGSGMKAIEANRAPAGLRARGRQATVPYLLAAVSDNVARAPVPAGIGLPRR